MPPEGSEHSGAGTSDQEVLIAPPGAVDLQDKASPIFEQEARGRLQPRAAPFVFNRGTADISLLLAKLAKEGEAAWDEEEHARTNVRLTRPAHDTWGVRKVVFVYCDDFLKRVYSFPWFSDPEWRAALEPVLQCLGVPASKVVRCLLASMPPGCVIPVHHDTGYWVKHTHR
jgi:hypothetical protein